MAITHNTDYLGQARRRMLSQFKNKPRLDALLESWCNEFQAAEDALWDVYTKRLLQNDPTGDLLDKIGKIVGQPRNGSSDDQYRVFITARIQTNRSDGKRETLLSIASLLLPNSGKIVFREYVKAIEIEANSVEADPHLVWQDFFQRAKDAGTSLRFFSSSNDKSHTLTRTSVSGGVTTVSTQRKGSVSAPGGGKFAAVFG